MLSLRCPLDIQMEIPSRQDIFQGSEFIFRYDSKAMKLGDITQGVGVDRKEARGLSPGDIPTFRGEKDEGETTKEVKKCDQ